MRRPADVLDLRSVLRIRWLNPTEGAVVQPTDFPLVNILVVLPGDTLQAMLDRHHLTAPASFTQARGVKVQATP